MSMATENRRSCTPGQAQLYAAIREARRRQSHRSVEIRQGFRQRSGRRARHGHRGDINGDGRMDIVNSRRWWEQPAHPPRAEGHWKFHAHGELPERAARRWAFLRRERRRVG